MNNYLLLIGISCVPAVTGMCITLPLWRLRHLRNQAIHTLGLTVLFLTLASCLLPVITGENSGTGFAAIALSCINFFLFRHYERLLYTMRLPPRDTPRPRGNPPHLPAPLQTVRTLHRLA